MKKREKGGSGWGGGGEGLGEVHGIVSIDHFCDSVFPSEMILGWTRDGSRRIKILSVLDTVAIGSKLFWNPKEIPRYIS